MTSKIKLGIDLGGSKIEIVAMGEGDSNILLRQRVATPQDDYAATLNVIAQLVREFDVQLGAKGSIGIGTPGAISKVTGKIKNANSTCLNGQPLAEDLTRILQRPIRIANDANCFALSEAIDGAAMDSDVVFGVILGTGVGGGIVVNQRVLTGPNSIAGEWGHNPLPWPQADELPGPKCYCGKSACIESFISGPGLSRDHEYMTGEKLEAQHIVDRATAGDQACEETLLRYEDRLARALAHVINILDPDAIVLGGGLSNMQRLYKNIPQRWAQYVFSDRVDTRLVKNKHGDSSGVRGAAWLWNDN